MTPVLSVRELPIDYRSPRGWSLALNHVSLDLQRGSTPALIGERGCGKSALRLGLMRLLPNNARIPQGQMLYSHKEGGQVDIVKLSANQLRRLRWQEIAMV